MAGAEDQAGSIGCRNSVRSRSSAAAHSRHVAVVAPDEQRD
jgi:hypothetical protein